MKLDTILTEEVLDKVQDPITSITFILKNGVKLVILTPLSSNDFMRIWDSKRRVIRIPSEKKSFISIRKRNVDFINIIPISNK